MAEAEAVQVEDAVPAAAETPEPSKGPSDDQILDDSIAKAGKTEGAPADEAVAKTTEEAKPATEQKPEETKEELPDERLDPAELKAVFKKFPALRAEHYTLAAYKEVFPDVQSARELRSMFTTKEEAQETLSVAERALQLDEEFRTSPEALIGTLHQADPRAFFTLVDQLPRTIYQNDPATYQRIYVEPVLSEFTRQFGDWAKTQNDEEAQAAIQIIAQRLGNGARPTEVPANDPRMLQLRQYEQEREQRAAASADIFYDSVGTSVKDAVTKEATDFVSASVVAANLLPDAKKEIVDRVVDEVGEILKSDSFLQKRISFFARAGQASDPKLRDSVVNLMMSKARNALRPKAQERINWMTKNILGLNKQTRENAPRHTKEVGEGASVANTGPKRPSLKESAKMTPEEIIEAFSS